MDEADETPPELPPAGRGETAHETPEALRGPAGDTPLFPASDGPTLTLGEAHRVTGVARSTLQRRLQAGLIAGAHRTSAGGWSIPVAGLIAAGIMPKASPPDPTPAPTPETLAPLQARLTELEQALAITQAELGSVRVLADERGQALADLRKALDALSRAIGPGTTSTSEKEVPAPAESPPPLAPSVPGPHERPTIRTRWAAWRRG